MQRLNLTTVDYFAAPAIVESAKRNGAGVEVSLKAPGQVVAYSEQELKSVAGGQYRWENGVLEIDASDCSIRLGF